MADLIKRTDTLNQGREKLNTAITDANRAKWDARTAKTKAEQALLKSESTQTQLNEIVIEGDSSVEAAQARVSSDGTTYGTLKQRLDTEYEEVTSQLEQIEQELEEKASKTEVNLIKKKIGGVKFIDLTVPMVFAHRGAKNIFPESSIEAYRACVDIGLPIELDVRMSADGTLVVNHDASVNRTTNRTGLVDSYSVAGFKNMEITELGTDLVGTPTTLRELFIEFGNKALYIIESKERGTAQPIVDMILEYKLEENCLFQSFNRNDLNSALQVGIPTMYLTDVASPVDIKNDEIDYVGVSKNVSESYIADCLSEGLKVGVYTINRRFEYDNFLNLGVTAFFSDDPLWITGKSKVLSKDPFEQKTYYHGMVGLPYGGYFGDALVEGNRGSFTGAGQFGWLTAVENSDFTLQGWAGKLPETFKLKANIYLKEFAPETNRWFGIQFCTPIDMFDDYSELANGYNVVLRQSGYLQLYKRENGVATNMGQILTPELELSQRLELEIEVTSTTVTVTRTDPYADNESVTINDTTFRRGYLHFGRRSMAATFGNVTILPV